ncbi:unnamed protein product [Ascophyllum nodosum]
MAETETKEYDITECPTNLYSYCCWKTTLELQPTGVVVKKTGVFGCSSSSIHRPYHEISQLETIKWCCCWAGFKSNLVEKDAIWPGCGCQGSKVEEIVKELTARMEKYVPTARGNEELAPVDPPAKPMEMESRA